MPPLFQFKLDVDKDILESLRELPKRSQIVLRRRLQEELGPELQANVDALMEQGPEPVSSPFVFGTDKSRNYYFWMISQDDSLTDGQHWIRTGDIESQFHVDVSDRLRSNLVRIFNNHTKAKYVFGPFAVAGHINTGWPEQAEFARQLLREYAISQIIKYWYESVQEALKTK